METNGKNFHFELISASEAEAAIGELRGLRGSKYDGIVRAARELEEHQAVRVELDKNEVGALRGHLRRRHGDAFRVKSARADDGVHVGFVFRAQAE